MDITTFMIAVYCLIDDALAGQRLRKRGPQPTLRDSEVLTIEVVGEFLGLDTIDVNVLPPHYAQTADNLSEEWVQRFREERQKSWENKGW